MNTSAPPITVRIQSEDFSVSEQESALLAVSTGTGAITAFSGYVREQGCAGRIERMELEHYPGMTEKAITEIAEQATRRWPLLAISVIHRVGELLPEDRIVYVGVASSHRGDGFAACEFVMDYLKTRAPFWKKELTPEGANWVDAKQSDNDAASRW